MLGNKKKMDDILSAIRKGKVERDKIIGQLYHDVDLRNKVQTMLYSMGGKSSDFNHIFNSSLMQFIKTVVKNKELVINSSIPQYIVGIAKYVWYKEIKTNKDKRTENIEEIFDMSIGSTPEDLVIDHNQKEVIHKILGIIGKKCKEVLMYWANGYKMREIAKLVGYKSEGMAKKKKHLCMNRLQKHVANNPSIISILR